MLLRTFHETVEHREHRVDYLGATLLTVSLSLLRLLILAAFAFAPNIILVVLCCLVVGLGLGVVSNPRPYRRGSHRYAPAARGARHG